MEILKRRRGKIDATSNDAIGKDDCVALLTKIKKNKVSPDEIVSASIARALKVNNELNAIVNTDFDNALNQAGQKMNGLGGLPTFFKDTDESKGLVTTMGSRAVKQVKAKKDSAYVKQLKNLGLIGLGKSTMPEFGLTASTEAVLHGPTRNPWNTDYSPGGSSGGACALVASGVINIGHANDGGGSIRLPASCCGLVGLKPSRGRTAPMDGSQLLPVNLVSQGVVTRSVRDTALFYSELEKHFPAKKLPPMGQVDGAPKGRLRIALVTTTPHASVDKEIKDATVKAARLLESQGHTVDHIEHPFEDHVLEDFFILWCGMAFTIKNMGSALYGRGFKKQHIEPFTDGLSKSFQENLLRAPGVIKRLRQFERTYDNLFEGYDCLLTPTACQAPPKIGHLSPTDDFENQFLRIKAYAGFTPYQNISGAPAISVPIRLSKTGLPIGVQLASAWGQERLLLGLAYELEGLSKWRHLMER